MYGIAPTLAVNGVLPVVARILSKMDRKIKMGGLEDQEGWAESLIVNIRCRECSELMDEPHCDQGGCPWCFRCGPNSIKEK